MNENARGPIQTIIAAAEITKGTSLGDLTAKFREELPALGGCDFARDGVANSFEVGEVPQVRKCAALTRFDGLDGAIVAEKEDAFAVGFVRQRKATAVLREAGVTLNEVVFESSRKAARRVISESSRRT